MTEINFSNIWNTLKKSDEDIKAIINSYKKLKSDRKKHTIPGRRTMFMTATEFRFLPGINQLQPITKPLVFSTDGIYCIGRMSYECYLENTTPPVTTRSTMISVANGLVHPDFLGDSGIAGYTNSPKPVFDFEWDLAIGSNERHYSTDSLGGGRYLSRETLLGNNYKQLELMRSYFLKGNEFFALTVKPTLNTGIDVAPNRAFIVSIVTIGHKILGYTGLENIDI